MPKLKVSISTYNEISTLLERMGIPINEGQGLILEKGTNISCDVDFRLAVIKKDCLIEAIKLASNWRDESGNISSNDVDVIGIANKMYEFVIGKDKSNDKT